MSFTLRRSQSLKSLSGGHSSWSTSDVLFRDRRTPVSQLVERYESCVDLTDVDREEACSKSSGLRRSNHEESKVENLWRRYESLSGTNNTLSRSISMDMLPQPDLVGPNAQRVLFESKKYASSPRLNVTPQTKSSPVSHSTSQWREAPMGWEKVYSGATTVTNAKKDKAHQKEKTFNETMRRRTISGVPGCVTRSSTGLNDEKKLFKKDRESASYQDHKPKNTNSPIPSVKDRSVLYLSKVAAADSSGYIEQQGSVFQEHVISSGKKKKQSKFLSPAQEMCSACLMPVYPVEKMVADKLILHSNCFCCKHCNKKLSIYNYSALYGEFYCPSHYHQLFKKKGNYDEGFGHRQHKDRWLVKTEEPKPTNKFSSAHKTEPTCVDATVDDSRGPSSRHQRHKDDQFKCPDNTNKLRISWPPENKRTRHSHVSQNTSSASRSTTDWSNHKRSGARSSRNALEKKRFNSGLDEMDKSVQLSPRVYEKTNTYVTPFTIKSAPHSEDVYTPHPRGSKTLQKTADRSGTQSKVSTGGKVTSKYLNSVTSRQDSLRENNLAEDGKADSPTKIKKSVRFVSNLNIDEENNTEISSEEAERSTDAFVEHAAVNGSVMTADMTTFESGIEIEESPVEGLIDKMHHPYSHDSVEHPKALDGQMQDPFLPTVGKQKSEKTKANEANMSEMETMLNLDELQINDIPACGKETFKPGSESCDLEQVDEMKKEVVIESNAKAVTPNNQEPTDIIKVESKVPDMLDMPPKSDNKSNTKVADKKAMDKGNKGSWSKGKSPLSKLFTSGPNRKENKSETKMESKRPRNVLGRLFSSSEIDLEIKKTPEIKPETTCEKEPEKTVVTEDDTALIQENVSVSPPSTEPTCQNTPQEPIKPTQNQLSDAAEEPNLIDGLENPILLPNGSSADETVPSINLESIEQHKPASVGFGEIDINEALIPSQEHIHVDLASLDSSKPSSLEESLNSSLPQNEDPTGFLDSSDASQFTGPTTDAMAFSGSDTLDYTHSDSLTDNMDLEIPSVDIGSSFIHEDPFGEKAQGESGDMTSSPVNFNQKTLDIFGSSESNIEANSYGFGNTLTEANKNEAGVSSEMTDDPFGMNNAPVQTMDIFGGNNMLTVFDQSSTNNFFDIMTNSETQSQNPFEGITDGQLAPNGVFDFISSEGDPSTLSVTSNVFEQKSSDLEQENLIQSEVNNVFYSKGNQSTSHVPDQNLSGQELIESSQIEDFDFFSSEKDPSTAAFSHMSADPFPNDIFASVIDSTDTNTFSMEITQRAANPFDDFTGLESHGEAAETKASNLFPDDIFSSVPAMSPEPAQDTSSIADPRNPDTNAVLQQKPENDWMSDFLG